LLVYYNILRGALSDITNALRRVAQGHPDDLHDGLHVGVIWNCWFTMHRKAELNSKPTKIENGDIRNYISYQVLSGVLAVTLLLCLIISEMVWHLTN
jgi:hypothetical protein